MSKKLLSPRTSWRSTLGLLALSAAGLMVSCNSHPVSFTQAEGAVAITEDRSPDSAATVDILWMIDNSGSMCQEQEAIRTNFEKFVEKIAEKNIDFQMGVTTTHMSNTSPDELARPGYLQAIPQPVQSVSEGCAGRDDPRNTDSDPTNGYVPIRVNIEQAIACTKDPTDEKWNALRNVTDQEIACVYKFSTGPECEGETRERHQLYPTTPSGGRVGYLTPPEESPYRQIKGEGGKVLRSSDYIDPATNKLDVESLKADFACMSLVGTQGSGVEKGLAAAVHAVSPEMTGGTVEKPVGPGAEAPNHGLLRENANFAMVFVTDENDCSDYGLFAGDKAIPSATAFTDSDGNPIDLSVNERTSCLDTVCAIYNTPGFENSPLIKTEEMADRLMENLDASKGKTVNKESVVVTSIHGEYRRYGESENYPSLTDIEEAINNEPAADQQMIRDNIADILINPNTCEIAGGFYGPYEKIEEQISCATEKLGTAFSGDRYERFLRNFNPDRVLPPIPDREGAHMDGLICSEEGMGATLGKIGELIAGTTEQCITDPPYECAASEECPPFNFGEGEPSCQPFGQSSRNFCTSGLEMRLYPGERNSLEDLRNHPYCIPESVDSAITPGGCVISRSKYAVVPCAAKNDALNIEWAEEDASIILAGYKVKLIYAVLPEQEAAPDANADGN